MNNTARIVTVLLVAAVAVVILILKPGVSDNSGTELSQATGLPKLLDLGAETCIPCKKMKPILADLADQYSEIFTVEVINIRDNEEIARLYDVSLIPTQIWFDADGMELFRHQGFIARDAILAKWRELGLDIPS